VPVTEEDVRIREGTAADLAATFELSERTMHDSAVRQGVVTGDSELTDDQIRSDWVRQRPLVEFIAAQPDGRYLIAENGDGPVGYARVVRFDAMEELTELMVCPRVQGSGIGRALLERCWPSGPTRDLGRVVVAAGAPSDLSLYTEFGVMPVSGHWHMRQRTDAYVARRARDPDNAAVHLLAAGHAVEEWQRLEPAAIGHRRPALHEFFARGRSCLAVLDPRSGEAKALCWVSSEGEIGPAVGATAGDHVPVVLGALDRVAKMLEPEYLHVFTTTLAWWLLRRLRTLGFTVFWPGWVMCSEPLPGLDRYTPTRPPHLL
jgi:GNAT superfamily N-acetyltransferase